MTRRLVAQRTVALIPVLEVLPYAISTRPLPDTVTSRDHPIEWSAYFQQCLADAGFHGVAEIAPGSSFVAARSLLGHPLLEYLIRKEVGADQEACSFDGGLMLVVDDTR